MLLGAEATENEPPAQGSSDEPAIEVVGVHKSYGEVRALRGISLQVRHGQFVTLLGSSGSGKTSLLQVMAGFLDPDSGRVRSLGRDITSVPAHKRGFGLVFQHYSLFPHMTVHENVAYPLRMRSYDRKRRGLLVTEYLHLVEIDHLAGRYPQELSGGERQRVALARALVYSPPVLLMDEPLGALDRRLRQSLQFQIKRIQQELHATVIYVTHDQEEALAMSDLIAVMRDGVIEQMDSSVNVYTHPASPFVASFIGETNRLEVVLRKVAGTSIEAHHEASDQTILIDRAMIPAWDGSPHPATLCIRPESIRTLLQPVPGCLQGTLLGRTFMGDHWRYEIRVGSTSIVATDPVGRGGPVPEQGQVSVDFDRSQVQIFLA